MGSCNDGFRREAVENSTVYYVYDSHDNYTHIEIIPGGNDNICEYCGPFEEMSKDSLVWECSVCGGGSAVKRGDLLLAEDRPENSWEAPKNKV